MPAKSLRLLFAGTPTFAASHLAALIDSKHSLLEVYTQPDRPAGRGKKLRASPVKDLALAADLPLSQPASLRDKDVQAHMAGLQADVLIVVAYGLILPQAVLDIPALGCLNVHASLLPRWRGAAPIQRAIEAGDADTGITIMQMEAGLDTGPILATASCSIDEHNAASLEGRLAELGPPLLLDALDDLEQRLRCAQAQDDNAATYAAKISKEEALIDWRLDADTIARKVRAFNPFPVCFTELQGERLRIWEAEALASDKSAQPGCITNAGPGAITVQCGRGEIAIRALQLPGGRRLAAGEMLHAKREKFAVGKLLGAAADTE